MVLYRDIFKALDRGKVRYLVAGGVALNLHQIIRSTMDLDLIVHLQTDNVVKFISVMRKLGYLPRVPVNPEDLSDKKKREAVEIKNHANSLIYTAEKSLSDAGDKVSSDIKKPIQDKVDELKKIKDSEDIDLIKKTTEELSKILQTIGEAMQKNAQSGSSAGGQKDQAEQKNGGNDDGKTREADFEEKK